MREPWLVLVPTWAGADGCSGTPGMSPALNYRAYSNWSLAPYSFFFFNPSYYFYATPTHLPSICPFTRPHVLITDQCPIHAPSTCTLGLDPCTLHSLFGRTDRSLLHWHFLLLLRPLAPCRYTCLPSLCNCTVLPVHLPTGPYLAPSRKKCRLVSQLDPLNRVGLVPT